ncbi:hypothetical protein CLHOM_11520 [Clostridium homopropionicum DSM 5847]|uniref:Uncharacterized protein n=1 Tax=Clostridium homopropionicum DSM 5847 TaxID=1121318 RepID=A0A0L6ZC54_9CLOT|nr:MULTISPECIES: hypothetical protein [Clostridium]KOA20564.1 hypothetical protein CLHOM_11520 [Clostridium homopropionicum DSM 5847]QAT41022.1 hypothetical protein EQM05_12515 [Clostridium sp. JN-9]SFG39020.1 hypothetical protein SAMN04488501_108157 [Clostridium homopropionicum]
MKNKKKILLLLISCIFIITLVGCGGGSKETTINDDTTKAFDELMTKNSNLYDYGEYKLITKSKETTLDVYLMFKSKDIYRVGTVTAIRNLVVEHLSGKYKENTIHLQIGVSNGGGVVDYVYKNDSWDKEVE